MDMSTRLASVTQALADPLRLALLQQLMGGPTTVSELVALTGASQPNVSNHLALLRERGLVRARREGRQSIYEIGNPAVAQLVESLALLAGTDAPAPQDRRPSPALAAARTCYDHLAGQLGVALFDALVTRGALEAATTPGSVALGREADHVFGALAIDLAEVRRARRRFATACLDWTERRPHLGGALGAAVWAQAVERGWVVRQPGSRAALVTDAGRDGFERWVGVELACGGHAPNR